MCHGTFSGAPLLWLHRKNPLACLQAVLEGPFERLPLLRGLVAEAQDTLGCSTSSRPDIQVRVCKTSGPSPVQPQAWAADCCQVTHACHGALQCGNFRTERVPGQAGAAPRSAPAVEARRHVRAADPLAAARFQRRHAPAATELLFLHAGDANGLCHHLGTDYSRAPFVNPVLAGRLQVRALLSASASAIYRRPQRSVGACILTRTARPSNLACLQHVS